ncbi:phytoene synthase (plasmid) [Sulfitobacter alexandrii]|uniref:Phytoene synthase n=1 Tax=Sulfitobacter alexandrii TaxID=1917485 RepID=A0A1J0WNI8_9RHOB|nr:phytoene/squalene synthase family protein [Sulfitobacter alexandrii]APE45728.1 phytoene synthase [Sulfitobacter alexandrii]
MIRPEDMAHCRAVIRTGSLSFHTASRLLPAAVRDPALALYAFCRLADDEVDEGSHKARAVLSLRDRLDDAYAGRPRNAPEDRAFAALVEEFEMPRVLPEALLEGLAWDADERRYRDLSGVIDYSARVASAVGAMMCILMRVRDPDALARACDLGVAMQLTNIARDVGEDARAGRLYLPLDWIEEAGLTPSQFLAQRSATPATRRMVRRLLAEAQRLYLRSEAGVAALPRSARSGIFAARFVYAGIGAEVRRNGYDSITRRAHTSRLRKLGWVAQAGMRAAGTMVLPRSAVIYARPLPEVQFLVDAGADALGHRRQGRTAALLDVLSDLDMRERDSRMAAE